MQDVLAGADAAGDGLSDRSGADEDDDIVRFALIIDRP